MKPAVLFTSPLVLRLLKMGFGVFKRQMRLIIKVCRHKFDIFRRVMNFSNVPANFISIALLVLELQQKLYRWRWKYRTGPKTDPCGTPDRTGTRS